MKKSSFNFSFAFLAINLFYKVGLIASQETLYQYSQWNLLPLAIFQGGWGLNPKYAPHWDLLWGEHLLYIRAKMTSFFNIR